MQLFQRPKLTNSNDNDISPFADPFTDLTTTQTNAIELWRGRVWLGAGLGLAVLGLLAWGYVILPENSLVSWLWWPITIIGLALVGWWHWRQVQIAKSALATPQLEARQKRWLPPIPLGLLSLLAAGLILTTWITTNYPHALRYDSHEYSVIAFDYAQNGYKPHAIRTPGHTLLIAGIFKLAGGPVPEIDELFGPPQPAGTNLRAVWVAFAILLSLTALTTYGLVAELRKKVLRLEITEPRLYWGDPVALLAAGLVALCPFLIAYVGLPLTEIPATFWLTLTVYLWLKTLKYQGAVLYLFLLGLSLGWLMQTRPTFIYLPILVLATLLFMGKGWGRLWQLGIVGLGLALILWPQLAANLNTFDEPTPVITADFSTHQLVVGIYYTSVGGLPRYQKMASAASYDPTYEPVWERLRNFLPLQMGQLDGKVLSNQERKRLSKQESDYFKQYFADYVRLKPLEFAGTVGKRLWFMWDQHYVFPYYDPGYFEYRWLTDNLNRLYLIFGLVGIVAAGWRWGRGVWPLGLSLLYLTAVNSIVVMEFRYNLPGYPLLLAFTALGLWETGRAILGKNRGAGRIATLIGLTVATGLIVGLNLALPVVPPTNIAREKALDTMAQAIDRDQVQQFRQAEELYNLAIALYPGEAQLWSGRGNYFAGGRRPEKALTDYNKAIELDPQGFDFYRWRGAVLVELKRKAEALADYRKFLELAPANHPSRLKIEREIQGLQ